MMTTFEVEQKYAIDDLQQVAQQLREMGARFGEPVVQVDQYFRHPTRDFGQTDEALRIRRVGTRALVTYKGPKIDQTTKTRREIEFSLGDAADAADKFHALLETLGFHPVTAVRKSRRTAQLNYQGTTVELALDDVDQVGTYLEMELLADESHLDSARQTLANLASQLNLSDSERRSYLELLLERQGP